MTVELAVLMPVLIVVALVVLNLARFCQACAVFDRAAPDAVLTHGVAPPGNQTVSSSEAEVAAAIGRALDSQSCEVEVVCEGGAPEKRDGGVTFPVSPLLTTYRCTLRYRPWPGSFVMAGMAFDPPAVLRHERSLVVDRFRPGVIV
jgi:hypothetical protein